MTDVKELLGNDGSDGLDERLRRQDAVGTAVLTHVASSMISGASVLDDEMAADAFGKGFEHLRLVAVVGKCAGAAWARADPAGYAEMETSLDNMAAEA